MDRPKIPKIRDWSYPWILFSMFKENLSSKIQCIIVYLAEKKKTLALVVTFLELTAESDETRCFPLKTGEERNEELSFALLETGANE